MQLPRCLLVWSLTGNLSTGNGRWEMMTARARRNWILILVTVGVLLDLGISAVLALNYDRTRALASQSHQLTVGAYTACLSGNAFRLADAVRWNQVLALVNTQPDNPATIRFIAGVEEANRVADTPQHCQIP